jgi:hypothetical protein
MLEWWGWWNDAGKLKLETGMEVARCRWKSPGVDGSFKTARCGRRAEFSTLWKKVFHSVEKSRQSFP